MTSTAVKLLTKRVMAKEMNDYKSKKVESQYDPLYEMIPNPKKPGKMKKVKKQVPDYIGDADGDILARARLSAYRLDFCLFNFLGFRFGWSSVIGLIPAIGDAVDMLLALRLVNKMRKIRGGLPTVILLTMMFNIAIDFLVGLVPFVGDLADAALKCNSRNVRCLEEHLDAKYKPAQVRDAEARLPKERRPRPATVYEDFSDEEAARQNTFDDRHDGVQQPTRAYSGRKERVPDEEMGIPRKDTHRSHKSTKERPSEKPSKSSRRH